MITTVIVLSLTILLFVGVIIYLIMRLMHEMQHVTNALVEKDELQEKRIAEIKESLEMFQQAGEKLREIAKIHAGASDVIDRRLKEALEIINGNQYAIMQKLNELEKR